MTQPRASFGRTDLLHQSRFALTYKIIGSDFAHNFSPLAIVLGFLIKK